MQLRLGAGARCGPAEGGYAGGTAVPRTAVCAVMLAALVAGCSSESEADSGAPGPSPSATAVGDEDAALATYTAMWQETAAASHAGGGTNGDLDQYATDAALALLNEALAGAEGTEVSGEPVLDPEVEMEGDDSARVTDCLDDSGWSLDTGPSTGAGPRQVEAGLVHDGLAWRVSELRIWESGSC